MCPLVFSVHVFTERIRIEIPSKFIGKSQAEFYTGRIGIKFSKLIIETQAFEDVTTDFGVLIWAGNGENLTPVFLRFVKRSTRRSNLRFFKRST